MTTMKADYGALTACAITLASLPTGDAQASAAVDNTTDLFDDVIIQAQFTFAADPGSGQYVYLGAYGSLDGMNWWGAEYGLDGTDKRVASYSSGSSYYNFTNNGYNYVYTGGLGGVGTVVTMIAALSQLYQDWYYSPNQQVIPPWWGIILFNNAGQALSAVGADSFINYRGYYSQIV